MTTEELPDQLHFDAMPRTLAELQADNAAKVAEMATAGAQLNPAEIVMLRLDTLLDFICDDADRERLETVYQQRLGQVLDVLLQEVRRMVLARGLPTGLPPAFKPGGGLFLPGQ